MLHQLLELLGKRRFTPAHRTEEIEDLLLLFQPLRGVTEVGNDLVDALLHAMEILEGRITADHLVGEDARQSRVDRCVDQFGLADRHQQALGGAGIGTWVRLAQIEIFLEGILLLAGRFETLLEVAENAHDFTSIDARIGASSGTLGPAEVAASGVPPNT